MSVRLPIASAAARRAAARPGSTIRIVHFSCKCEHPCMKMSTLSRRSSASSVCAMQMIV